MFERAVGKMILFCSASDVGVPIIICNETRFFSNKFLVGVQVLHLAALSSSLVLDISKHIVSYAMFYLPMTK